MHSLAARWIVHVARAHSSCGTRCPPEGTRGQGAHQRAPEDKVPTRGHVARAQQHEVSRKEVNGDQEGD